MKKLLILITIIFSFSAYAQYRDKGMPTSSVYDGIVKTDSHSLFGFLNSDNFSMSHSFGLSYMTSGGEGLSLGTYTNSIMYKFSKNLNFQLQTSIVTSPYSTLGKDFQNSINGIYIDRAAINYKPSKDVNISLQYRQIPGGYYNSYYNPYYYGYSNSFNRNFYGFDTWDANPADDN
ncbi:MAG TPA: hypothetical protein VKA26_03620 [Ignavibacteriaceae bacterium]|nr:hypothetical protein [Ignavibacteriaceae bacterium]